MTKTIEEILAEAQNPDYHRVTSARILLRQDLFDEHARREAALKQALADDENQNRTPEAPRLAKELEEFEALIENERVEFKFRSVGAQKWQALIAKYPPTKEQLKMFPRAEYNPVTFPAAAVAASCVQPELTLDQARALEAALNQSAWETLFARACDANVGGFENPKSELAGFVRRLNAAYESSAPSTESPDQSSLAGS